MIADGVLDGLALADRLGLLAAVLPELTALHGVEQSHYHHLDVYDHTLEVLAQQIELERDSTSCSATDAARCAAVLDEPLGRRAHARPGAALRRAAARHRQAAPRAAMRPDGRVTFIGPRPAWRARWCTTLCRRLRTSERLARFLGALTRHHLVLGFLVHERPLVAPRRSTATCSAPSPVEVEVTLLSCADRLATARPQGRGRRSRRTSSWPAS